MGEQLVRIDGAMRMASRLPVTSLKTYSIKAPVGTHFRPATCEEAGCPNYLNGWKVIVLDETDPIWAMRVEYFRNKLDPRCDRRYREHRDEHNNLVFVFEAGQPCFDFTSHRIRIEREPLYVVRQGDARGNPDPHSVLVHADAADWTDDFGEHQERLATRQAQG